jgi:hypothetical protein
MRHERDDGMYLDIHEMEDLNTINRTEHSIAKYIEETPTELKILET